MTAYQLAGQVVDKGEEITLVDTNDEHNKYWKVKADKSTWSMLVHNGRLGTTGQHQKPKPCGSSYSLTSIIANKIGEKLDKGYRQADTREFEKLNTQGVIVGTQNKCGTLEWVEQTSPNFYTKVTGDRLQNPEYDPILLVNLQTRKPIGDNNEFWLMFTPDKSYELATVCHATISHTTSQVQESWSGTPQEITHTHPLHELAQKVELAMGREFGG